MDRYFKTEKTSATGLKVQEIEKRCIKLNEDINALKEKYGFKTHYYFPLDINGLHAVEFETKPDPSLWYRVKGSKGKGYYPKETNKSAWEDFQKITSISRYELDRIIGNNNYRTNLGYYFGNKDFYLFVASSEWEITLVDDLVEISKDEFIKLM